MENFVTSPKGDPPDDSKELLKLPKSLRISVRDGSVSILAEGKDEGFKECVIPYREFLFRVPASLPQVEQIEIDLWLVSEVELGEVCKALRTMPSLKKITFSTTGISGKCVEEVSKVLLDMSMLSMVVLLIDVELDESDAKLLVDILLQTREVQTFDLSFKGFRESTPEFSGMEHLCRYLKAATCVLSSLTFSEALIDEEGSMFASALGENKSLEALHFFGQPKPGPVKSSIMGSIADALHLNTTLTTLGIHKTGICELEMGKLVAALIPDSSGFQPNSTLTELDLSGCQVEEGKGVEHLCTLIKCNTSLVELNVAEWEELQAEQKESSDHALENVKKLLPSLQSNRSIKYLNLIYNSAIGGKKVLGMIMDMLLHNHTIAVIDLFETALEKGDKEIVYAELRKRRKEYELWLSVANMPPVSPNSARIFLCGNGEAGKTTICQKWNVMHPQPKTKKRDVFKNLLPWKSSQQGSSNTSTKGEPSRVTNESTRGIEVHKLVWGSMHISIWDMAGQEEYHSFHDLVVPNDFATGSCLYLIVCNPFNQDDIGAIKREIHHWFKFVASNTRKSESYRPHVTILMTHHDLWRDDQHLPKRLEEVILDLRIVFKDYMNFDEGSCFIPMDNGDGKSSDALQVKQFAEEYLKTLSTKVPKVVKATIELQSIVAAPNANHADRPFVDWEEFEELCGKVDELKPSIHVSEAIMRKKKVYVAKALHDGGHIMYYEDLDMVIMNPQWFCHDIMGTILFECSRLNPKYSMISNGTIPRKYLEEVFHKSLDSKGFGVDPENFLSIMVRLQICYKDMDDNFLFPCLFKSEKEVKFSWPAGQHRGNLDYSHIGTCLASKDPTTTTLTVGFFPCLQVFLRKFVSGVAGRSYKSLKDSIQFRYEGSDVYIEYKNDRIDIMTRSSGTDGYELHVQIMQAINDLRSSAMMGCAGVDLEELILRPYCVEELSPYGVRYNQVVSKNELKTLVTSVSGLKYEHHWEENGTVGFPGGYDSAESLLPLRDWQGVLQSCSERLNVVEKALASKQTNITSASAFVDVEAPFGSSDSLGDPSDSHNLKEFFRSEFQLLRGEFKGLNMKMDRNHDELIGILRGLKNDIIHRQEVLCSKVSSNVSNLMEFSIQLLQSRVPKYPIFVPDSSKKNVRQAVKRLVPGFTSGRLYFFCEHRDGFHLVPDQRGLDASYGTAATRKFGSVMFWRLSVFTMLLKVGAHVGAGMGDMVPYPLFKEFMTALDTPGLVDMGQPSGRMLEFLPDELKKNARITSFDNQVAEDWLVDFLKSECKTVSSLHEKLGLNRVAYVNHSSGSTSDTKPVVAWICDDHLESGKRNRTLEPLGNSIWN